MAMTLTEIERIALDALAWVRRRKRELRKRHDVERDIPVVLDGSDGWTGEDGG